MNKSWSKYHMDCPYCKKIIKVHIIFKPNADISPVTDIEELNE